MHVDRTIAEMNPTLRLKSFFPKRKVTKKAMNPAKAEGRRLADSLFSPRIKVERLTSQKNRGGFSG